VARNEGGGVGATGQSSCAAWMSVWHRPDASIRTVTWPSPGIGRSSTISGLPNAGTTADFALTDVHLAPEAVGEATGVGELVFDLCEVTTPNAAICPRRGHRQESRREGRSPDTLRRRVRRSLPEQQRAVTRLAGLCMPQPCRVILHPSSIASASCLHACGSY